ncbi:MAG: YraN family protein [Pseudomonadota bacterium]
MARGRGSDRQQLGWSHESLALEFLRREGLALLARNYHCRHGEIDLVMREHDVLVSVEVRFRSRRTHGGAALSIDHGKQRRWMQATEHFLAVRPEFASLCVRFDVVAVDAADGDRRVSWLRDAVRPL